MYTTLGYIVSRYIVSPDHQRFCETIWYIVDYMMFHQEASVETIKMMKIETCFYPTVVSLFLQTIDVSLVTILKYDLQLFFAILLGIIQFVIWHYSTLCPFFSTA